MFLHPLRSAATAVAVVMLASGTAVPATAVSQSPHVAAATSTVDRAEVLRSVRVTSPTAARLRSMGPLDRAKSLGRCFPLVSVRYCLGQGFTERVPNYQVLASSPAGGKSGDLSFGAWARRRAALTNAQRLAAEQAELADAVEALPGVLRLLSVRDALKAGRSADVLGLLPVKTIMAGKQTRQERSNWCGPATIQSIGWAATGRKELQSVWAQRLGTYSGGSGIYEMVAQLKAIDKRLKRKREHYVMDVARSSVGEFYTYHQLWMGWAYKQPEPVIEHPRLLARYFNYLSKDHGGHFQVGRGYRTVEGIKKIQIFEVFNEVDFTPGGKKTWGPQEVSVRNLFEATLANSEHKNIGL